MDSGPGSFSNGIRAVLHQVDSESVDSGPGLLLIVEELEMFFFSQCGAQIL